MFHAQAPDWRFLARIGWAMIAAVGGFRFSPAATAVPAQQPLVDKLVLSDTIQPVSAGELDRAIARPTPTARRRCWWSWIRRAAAGLDALHGRRHPQLAGSGDCVCVSGGRARGFGGLLPAGGGGRGRHGSRAPTPARRTGLEFGKPDETMSQKIENDAEAFLRSYVTKRNRNARPPRPPFTRRTPTPPRRRWTST
jgi:membrane-bound serine protease (ClpP class)